MTDDDILRIAKEARSYTDERYPEVDLRLFDFARRILAEAKRGAEPVAEITEGVRLISIERNRQIASELWTAMHDAEHDAGELAAAGAAYAINAADQLHPYSQGDGNNKQPAIWPWADGWWKPKNPQRDLARAGALIAAELDRLYAAPQRTAQGQDCNNRQKQNAVDPAPAAAPDTQTPIEEVVTLYEHIEAIRHERAKSAELRAALEEAERKLQDAGALARRLTYALKRSHTNEELCKQSVDLLKRLGLGGQIVRAQ